ncbi:MAG TPA: hypothetical protein DCX07_04085, partial [Phycisphaerales bacterium]|nr:hypothetical protein [Phycisphaerales bacterium]
MEDKLAPADLVRPWARDLACIALLAALSAVLLPTWQADGDFYRSNVVGVMLSPCLPAALGMLLALRCGAIDLSVWGVMGVGGLVAAGLIRAGVPAAMAFAAAGGAGL